MPGCGTDCGTCDQQHQHIMPVLAGQLAVPVTARKNRLMLCHTRPEVFPGVLA